jgi:ribosomal protein S18 acetylase RimI-like enzyme
MVKFRKALIPDELDALCEFDRRTFNAYPADLYSPDAWRKLEPYWMVVDGKTVGCSAFRFHSDYDGSPRCGTISISTTGVLPEFQNRGFGRLQKEWQIEHAKLNGFSRMVTCVRESNERIIRLNKKLGFKTLRLYPEYYKDPEEAAIVMELDLRDSTLGENH